MTNLEINLLSKMKKLVKEGKRYFAQRKDRDYLQDLVNLGITEEEAWNHVLTLNCHFYSYDKKPEYSTTGALIFKKEINGKIAYIKLKIEKNAGEDNTVSLSFHEDNN